jgi:hypothetical protein
MAEQLENEGTVVDPMPDAQEQQRLAAMQEKRKKNEKLGFIIMLIGFATLLIPRYSTGKIGEYTMFAGAFWYFSARFRYR